ncbi:RHS repeat protein [Moritella sp. 36]|uniref:RHS repeat domain-containing protein n=1 Tax=Moritella sp. 36 TaxID=2746233 RepID=UPI001BA8879F|nr:RHS repeat protein [Moritella sp. 36]QUM90550.1 RHS repeat protein [Moritella sp. 36]
MRNIELITFKKWIAILFFNFVIVTDVVSESIDITHLEQTNLAQTKNENVPLETLGDKFDQSSGSVVFTRVDGDIPGNSDLQVAYKTSYSTNFPNQKRWREDIPRIELNYGLENVKYRWGNSLLINWLNEDFCSKGQKQPKLPYNTPSKLRSNTSLVIPGLVNEPLLMNNETLGLSKVEYPYITNSKWRLSCYTSELTNAEGFKATSPNGDIYYFDMLSHYPGYPFIPNYSYGMDSLYQTNYEHYHGPITLSIGLMVSKIEDRFGNWVKYEYDDYDTSRVIKFKSVKNRRLLTKIHSNDKREIIISRNKSNNRYGSYVETTINSSGRTWKYSYGEKGEYYVTRPDGRKWVYDLDASSAGANFDLGDGTGSIEYLCRPSLYGMKNMTIKSPDGLTGIFEFDFVRTDKSNIRLNSKDYNKQSYQYLRCSFTFALQKKTLSVGGKDYEWNYSYSQNVGQFEGEAAKANSKLSGVVPRGVSRVDHKTISMLNPDSSLITYFINRKSRSYLEGTISAIKYQTNINGLLSTDMTEIYEYEKGEKLGEVAGNAGPYHESNSIPKKLVRVISITDGSEGEQEYLTEYHDYNQFGQPRTIIERTNNNSSKVTKVKFLHDISRWVLNLPTKKFISSLDGVDILKDEIRYYPDSLLPYQKSYFGRQVSTHTYHDDGNLKKSIYNGSNRYELFDNYYRGTPTQITVPCATVNGCNLVNGSTTNTMVTKKELNSDGTIKSETDFKGVKTNYSYNSIGRITKVDYVTSSRTDKHISYSNVGRFGLLQQIIRQGNFEKVTDYDGLLRPTLTRIRDKKDSDTIRYHRTQYDYNNSPVFQSFPSVSANNTIGITTKYDSLGRIVSTTRQSDGARSTIEYLSGNKQRIKDAKGNVTNATFLAYGSPRYDMPIVISAPESVDTRIIYNKFDQVTSIAQGGVTEKRLYDSYQQLCKIYRPETGVTAYSYNAQRKLIWIAEGTDGGSDSCAATRVPDVHKVRFSYDNRDQLRTKSYPDKTPDKTYSYDANGNLTRLESGIGLGSVIWRYWYNSLNLIDKESLLVKGENFILDWGYNSLGAVSWLTYPSGKTIHYAPNALGQATKASEGSINYASNIKYHPNGKIKQLTYGNGIVRNVVLDTTGRVDAISDGKMGDYQLYLDASYDDNDNLSSLVDRVDHSNDIYNISYDGLNRLKTADGKWGSGSYNYDDIGNILSRSISGSVINYNYNSANQLINIRGAYSYNYAYDTRGNVINNGRYSLAFNRANQVSSAKEITYMYDGHNRRVAQIKSDGTNYSVYSQKGLLLHRRKASGDKVDNVYVGKQLIVNIDRR